MVPKLIFLRQRNSPINSTGRFWAKSVLSVTRLHLFFYYAAKNRTHRDSISRCDSKHPPSPLRDSGPGNDKVGSLWADLVKPVIASLDHGWVYNDTTSSDLHTPTWMFSEASTCCSGPRLLSNSYEPCREYPRHRCSNVRQHPRLVTNTIQIKNSPSKSDCIFGNRCCHPMAA